MLDLLGAVLFNVLALGAGGVAGGYLAGRYAGRLPWVLRGGLAVLVTLAALRLVSQGAH